MRSSETGCSVDTVIEAFDRALRSVFDGHQASRPSPARPVVEDPSISEADRSHAASLMRVNHVGEVCAQALYQGQALAARAHENRRALEQAALEEQDHLVWSAERIRELGGRPSLLNPLWFAGAFALGAAAGALGDRWNLAFLAETEHQVEAHLEGHLAQLAPDDQRTRAVVTAMRDDEARHRDTAIALGAADLPEPIKLGMRVMAKLMTTVAYRI
jgi:ubiquinone biosynthesis monooxygenase Coq7